MKNTDPGISGPELQKQLSDHYATQLASLTRKEGPSHNESDSEPIPPAPPRPDPHLRQEIESCQKRCSRLSDEKVTLATQAYDLVIAPFCPFLLISAVFLPPS